jgi:hypothetical protein
MNAETLIAVQAYAGDKHQVETMLDGWLIHDRRVVIISPEDSRVEIDHPDVECRWAGKRGWAGEHTLDRQLMHLEIMAEYPERYILYNDADSFCITPEIPRYLYDTDDTFFSNEATTIEMLHAAEFLASMSIEDADIDTREKRTDTKSAVRQLLDRGDFNVEAAYAKQPLVYQPPYFFSQRVLKGMIGAADESRSPENLMIPFIDWWWPNLVRVAGMEHQGYPDGRVFSLEQILGEIRMHDVRLVHPVKTRALLDRLYAEVRGV